MRKTLQAIGFLVASGMLYAESGTDRRIDYIEFPATDIQKTKQFYGQAFGWKFEDYGPDYVSFVEGSRAVSRKCRLCPEAAPWW
jgi:hypothetical protein